jgi:hypothetical protein
MRKTYWLLVPALALVVLARPAEAGFQAGDTTLQLGASFAHQNGSDVGALTGDAALSHFLTQGIELGVNQGVSYIFIDDADDVWSATTTAVANYNFGSTDSRFVPFVGAFGGLVYNDDDATGVFGPNAGFKVFVNDTTYVLTRYRYEWYVSDLEQGDVEDSDGNHVVTVGLGFAF